MFKVFLLFVLVCPLSITVHKISSIAFTHFYNNIIRIKLNNIFTEMTFD